MHGFSDDSSNYETTYSQDERIVFDLQQERDEELARSKVVDAERKEEFQDFFNEGTHDIFKLPGLTFLKFTHLKIKFSFEPSKIVTHVRKKVKFYCSLKFHDEYKIWKIRRDSFPVNYKWRIYRLFYSGYYFSVKDDSVLNVIVRIYNQLKIWAKEEEEFRMEKFMKYQNGEPIFLDSDDEELFLNEEQREELHHKRQQIWNRMKPPNRSRII